MKNILKTGLAATLLLAAACSEFDIQDQFAPEFHRIVSVAESPFIANEVQILYDIKADMQIVFHINRAGSDPSQAATISFEEMADDEIAGYTTSYTVLPSEFFTLPEPVVFAPGEERKRVEILFTGEQIAALRVALDAQEEGSRPYALAVKLTSSDGSSVHAARPCFIRPIIVEDTPEFGISAEGQTSSLSSKERKIIWFRPDERSLTMEATLAALPFDLPVTLAIDPDAIADFNNAYRNVPGFEEHEAFRQAQLDKTEFTIPAGTTKFPVMLELTDENIDRSRNVIIPMVLRAERLGIEMKIYAGFADSTPALALTPEMFSFGDGMSNACSFGTFPDNLIDGDPETSVTTGGNNNIWWYNDDNTYYGQTIDIDLGKAEISTLRIRFRTRSSLATLTPGNRYASVTENGKARPHEIGLGYTVDDKSDWTFLGREIVSEEKTSPTEYLSKAYQLPAKSRYIRFGILRTYALEDKLVQGLYYHANNGWWAELSELEIYNAKFYEV